MKLRIQSDSIRVRLTKTEAAALAAGQIVFQTTDFSPNEKLVTSVESSSRAVAPSASFDASRLAIVLPLESARRWAESDKVSIQAVQRIDDQHSLSLLIEKDFECLHHPEENTDAFPNPRDQKAK